MEAYLSFSQENLWYEIWPELSLAIGAIVVLGINLFYKSDSKNGLSGSLAIFVSSDSPGFSSVRLSGMASYI